MPEQPNFLIIMSDEHAAGVSSPYGHALVETPAMQCLADNGAVLENAYCNFPLCVPSRSSFMTGRYCSQIGVWDNAASLPSDEPTNPALMRVRGVASATTTNPAIPRFARVLGINGCGRSAPPLLPAGSSSLRVNWGKAWN